MCYSPPGDDTGTPVPYPNSCLARDLTNGSRTVFIQGMEIALEDYSYFAKSYGDEAATHKLKKGINSGAIQGRCYFISWSMNVKVEGRGVARHLDYVTHNHSNPANTEAIPYLSLGTTPPACAKDRKRVEKNCKEKSEDEKARSKRPFMSRRQTRRVDKTGEVKATKAQEPVAGWIDDHCDGLWLKPASFGDLANPQDLIGELTEIEQICAQAVQELTVRLEQVARQVGDQALSRSAALAREAAEGYVQRSAIKGAAGLASMATGPGAAVVAPLMAAAQLIDTVWTAGALLWNASSIALDLWEEIDRIKESVRIATEQAGKVGALIDKLQDPNQRQGAMADIMDSLATIEPCVRAKRCLLVPFRHQNDNQGKGCCPGQTGHHLINHQWMEEAGCPSYSKGGAPTVCVEGVNQNHGSHGRVHEATDDQLDDATDNWFLGPKVTAEGKISLSDAMTVATQAHSEAFATSGCDEDCIRAQLEEYYDSTCQGKGDPMLDAKDKQGKNVTRRKTR